MKEPLIDRIIKHLKIPGMGKTISIACDIPLRRRLEQDDIAENNLEYFNKGKKFCDITEPLYKAIELGELLECLERYGECAQAENCWVTRKGWCPRRKNTAE